MKNRPNIVFISHGGGPLPLLVDPGHKEMVVCLEQIATKIVRPSAILVISAHWEEGTATVTSGASPELIYDYYGFPPESYEITYPCKGSQQLAAKVYDSLKCAGVEARLDEERGFDHGSFIPLKIMYPEADIPCVQLSLLNSLDPDEHLRLGEALKDTEFDNLLVIGSGFTFHNFPAFFQLATEESKANNEAFDSWLVDTCSNADLSEEERRSRLTQWTEAPAARYCHPREEHLLPLHVCYGMTGQQCSEVFRLNILGKKSSMYLWANLAG